MKTYLKLFCWIILFSSYTTYGQDVSGTLLPTIAVDSLLNHIKILSSDEFEGRGTGQQGEKLTTDYLVNKYKELGLKPTLENGFLQEFIIRSSYLDEGEEKLTFGNFSFHSPTSFARSSFNYRFQSKLDLIYSSNQEDYQNKSLIRNNLIVIYVNDSLSNLPTILQEFADNGAQGVLFVYEKRKDYQKRKNDTYKILKKDGTSNLRFLVLHTFASAGIISNRLMQKDKFTLPITLKLLKTNLIISNNVIGILEGKGADKEYLIVCGHYDHLGKIGRRIYNGADDNASGISVLLEVARAIQKLKESGFQLDRSIVFIGFGAEEIGLLGSKHYVDHPIFPLAKTKAVFNMDMVGRAKKDKHGAELYLIGSPKVVEVTTAIAQTHHKNLRINLAYNNPETDIHQFKSRSDQHYFLEKKVPAIFLFTGTHSDYHKTDDDWEKINLESLQEISQLLLKSVVYFSKAANN